MSTIVEFPNFVKLTTIPFTADELVNSKILREERIALPLELKALIDPSIQLPINRIEMHKIEQDEIQAIEADTSDWEEEEGDELVYPSGSTSGSGAIPDVQSIAAVNRILEQPMEVGGSMSRLHLTDEALAAYASGSFEQIDALEKRAEKDWKPIADMVQNVGGDCLVKVEYDGDGDLYMVKVPEAKAGSMWVTSKRPKAAPGLDPSSSREITIHMYSASAGSLSVSSSIWSKVPLWLLPHLVSLVIGCLTGYALRRGAAAFGIYVFERLLRKLGIKWAARMGVLARGAVKFGGGLLSTVAVEGVFWAAWRKYAFTMSVYVFDTEHSWKATHVKLDNAEFPDGKEFEDHDLGRCSAPGAEIEAVGFRPKKQLHTGPSIHSYNFGNDCEVFRGLGAGMRFERDDGAQSAASKFSVPRWTACAISIEGNTPSDGLETFYAKNDWVAGKPKERITTTTTGGTEISAMWSEVAECDMSNSGLQREYKAKIFLGRSTAFGVHCVPDA